VSSEEDNDVLPDFDEQSDDDRPRFRASVAPRPSSQPRYWPPEPDVKPPRNGIIDLTRSSSDSPEPERFVPSTERTIHHFGSAKMDAVDFIYQIPVDVKPRIVHRRRAAAVIIVAKDNEKEDLSQQVGDGMRTDKDAEQEIEEIDDDATPPPGSDVEPELVLTEDQKRANEKRRQKR